MGESSCPRPTPSTGGLQQPQEQAAQDLQVNLHWHAHLQLHRLGDGVHCLGHPPTQQTQVLPQGCHYICASLEGGQTGGGGLRGGVPYDHHPPYDPVRKWTEGVVSHSQKVQ
jgi:hypothetical protein